MFKGKYFKTLHIAILVYSYLHSVSIKKFCLKVFENKYFKTSFLCYLDTEPRVCKRQGCSDRFIETGQLKNNNAGFTMFTQSYEFCYLKWNLKLLCFNLHFRKYCLPPKFWWWFMSMELKVLAANFREAFKRKMY